MAEEKKLNGYDLSRAWFDFCYDNPDRITPNHTALFFFSIELCNRLGWKRKFGLPTGMAMEAIGIKSYNTYKKVLLDLIEFGFLEIFQWSKNQYTANVVALSKNNKANSKALDKALLNQLTEEDESTGETNQQSTGESTGSIDKPQTNKPQTEKPKKQEKPDLSFCDPAFLPALEQWIAYRKKKRKPLEVLDTIKGQYKKILKFSGGNPELAQAVVQQSIDEGWTGLFELKKQPETGMRLGFDERFESGRRTYGTGKVTIPLDAPPRPGAQYAWNESSKTWIII